MDYLASAIFKSVEAVFPVNGQPIVSCESPATSSDSNSVQTPAEIHGKEMGNIDHWHKLNKTPIYPLSAFMCTFDTL